MSREILHMQNNFLVLLDNSQCRISRWYTRATSKLVCSPATVVLLLGVALLVAVVLLLGVLLLVASLGVLLFVAVVHLGVLLLSSVLLLLRVLLLVLLLLLVVVVLLSGGIVVVVLVATVVDGGLGGRSGLVVGVRDGDDLLGDDLTTVGVVPLDHEPFLLEAGDEIGKVLFISVGSDDRLDGLDGLFVEADNSLLVLALRGGVGILGDSSGGGKSLSSGSDESLELFIEITLDSLDVGVVLLLNFAESEGVGRVSKVDSFLVGGGDGLDDGINIVLVADDGDDDVAVLSAVVADVVHEVGVLAVANVVKGSELVETEDFDGGRAFDAEARGEVTVSHHIDGTEPDFLVGESGVLEGSRELFIPSLAVWAPVGVEGHDPDVVVIGFDGVSPVLRVAVSNTFLVEDGSDLSGEDGERGNNKLHFD